MSRSLWLLALGPGSTEIAQVWSDRKKALSISLSAAPGLLGWRLYASGRQLRMTAKTIGEKPVGLQFNGMSSVQKQPVLSQHAMSAAKSMVQDLLSD